MKIKNRTKYLYILKIEKSKYKIQFALIQLLLWKENNEIGERKI